MKKQKKSKRKRTENKNVNISHTFMQNNRIIKTRKLNKQKNEE